MKDLTRTLLGVFLGVVSSLPEARSAESTKPNIVYILCDDLGYGDVRCLNPQHGKIATPRMDRMAEQGMIFTDAHSSSSVCTPTRYGILTGRYNWRTHLQSGVLKGYDPALIARDRMTVATLLKQEGYVTGIIGKWHLGMGIEEKNPSPLITDGPTTRGFDSFFGTSASLDMPPFAHIENDRFTEPLTTTKTWKRSGSAAAGFEAEDVLPTFTRKAVDFIAATAKEERPFFLYMPLNSPHAPIVPSQEWQGKSGLGDYADFVMETDWAIGKVLDALDHSGIGNNTLVIVTSDNGPTKVASAGPLKSEGHQPTAGMRGKKTDIFDGGHRVPFIVRWPDRVKEGSRSDQTICLTDLMATCADIVGVKLPDNAGEDSVSILPALTEQDAAPMRPFVVHHSLNGSFAIRQGKWKLFLCADSGGQSDPKPGSKAAEALPDTQLYDLEADLEESHNVAAEHPAVVVQLTAALEKIIAEGRSTPGSQQSNDAAVQLRKQGSVPTAE